MVRYADTAGETADYPVPVAWRYRNYVIDAFNADKPYFEFVSEQTPPLGKVDAGPIVQALADAMSAVLAVVLTHWWPLAAGFALVWILRLLGLDPDVEKKASE